MRKHCGTCRHNDAEYPCYPHKTPCNECLLGKGYNAPSKWEAAEHYKPDTNADRFRAMSDEEQQKCVRRFREIENFADWLKQTAEGE